MSFISYFHSQDHKNWKKISKQKRENKKQKSLNFAESNAHHKTNARGNF